MEQAMEVEVNHYNEELSTNTSTEQTAQVDNPDVQKTDGVDVTVDQASGASEATRKEEVKEEGSVEPPQTQEAAEKVVTNAGLNMSELESEYIANGQLSEESYKKLEKAGIPKNMVDAYIAGQEAITQKIIDDVYSVAGGQNEYAQMCQWAEANLSKDDLAAYNSVMASGKKELIMLTVAGLAHRWKQSEGNEPKLTQGRVGSAGSRQVKGYQSSAEMIKAMQDKRYGRDPAYTRSVEEKVAHSTFFG